MSTCTLDQKALKFIILNYIELLIKCEKLQNRLEKLYNKLSTKSTKSIKNEILKVNRALNIVMIQIMNYQGLLNIATVPAVA